ncbi:MAG: glucosaminidase domain-containing protein [Campylobacterota bacterium]|nr:glucosaminidase domain-containing protein [Campylobacterota bacterium]
MKRSIWLLTGIVLLFLGGCSREESKETEKSTKKAPYVMTESRTVKTKSTSDITSLFNDINYSMTRWQNGDREIPRLYLTDISSRWGTQSQRISVKVKKAIFFQMVLPLILRSNELILLDRERLLALSKKFPALETADKKWLQQMAKRYKLSKKHDVPVDRKKLDKLLLRMNTIPPSLALAQAAEESGWGTSRFAMLGNSLFGQWDFSGNAMVPQQQRKELGNYGLARFKTPLDAVKSYMLNLNTHRAYKKLRIKRAELAKRGEKITGYVLAETLDKYSERRYAYVESLRHMMTYNHLGVADDAYLWDKETIFLTPFPDPKPKPKTLKVAKRDVPSRDVVMSAVSEGNQTKSTPTVAVEGNETMVAVDGQEQTEKNITITQLPESNLSTVERVDTLLTVESNSTTDDANSSSK